ncbi:hypothetical protein V490_05546 [Pseudogymnoascus sp. VKM F-3557]|nr:hypothetical protein V490_05546 [Pseudogymnoascus sp. VKM F-3557]
MNLPNPSSTAVPPIRPNSKEHTSPHHLGTSHKPSQPRHDELTLIRGTRTAGALPYTTSQTIPRTAATPRQRHISAETERLGEGIEGGRDRSTGLAVRHPPSSVVFRSREMRKPNKRSSSSPSIPSQSRPAEHRARPSPRGTSRPGRGRRSNAAAVVCSTRFTNHGAPANGAPHWRLTAGRWPVRRLAPCLGRAHVPLPRKRCDDTAAWERDGAPMARGGWDEQDSEGGGGREGQRERRDGRRR